MAPGTLQLSAANTYTGRTYVGDGTLRLGATERISNSSTVTAFTGASFALNNFDETIFALNGGGNVSLGSGDLTITGGSEFALSGVISGTGGITKTGSGWQYLSGSQFLHRSDIDHWRNAERQHDR